MFERKVTINGEVHLLKFKPFSEIPGRISRLFRRNQEEQLWQALAWGLAEPKHWPDKPPVEGEVDNTAPSAIWDGILDTLPMSEVMAIHKEWQKSADVTEGESPASSS